MYQLLGNFPSNIHFIWIMNIELIKQAIDNQELRIPDWMSKQLDPVDFNLLLNGKKTGIVSIVNEQGKPVTGKLQAFPGEEETLIQCYKKNKKQQIEYPKEIDGEKMSADQLKLLKTGKYLALKDGNYLKIDKELNRVLIYTGKELSMISKIGDYQLTPADREQLLNDKELTRVLQNKNGQYVLTSFKYDDKKRELQIDYEKTKVITKQEAQKYGIEQKIEDLNQLNANPEKVMKNFLEGNDQAMVQIKKLQAQGYSPSIDTMLKVTNGQESSRTNQLINAFGVDSKKFQLMSTIYREKEARSLETGAKVAITEIDIKTQKIQGIDQDGKKVTLSPGQIKTEKDYQLHIQSQSKNIGKSKGTGIAPI